MSEMVERVAKAIEPKFRGFGHGDMPLAVAREVARAAIEAMREPTKTMLEVAWDTNSDGHEENAELWRAMIDAALSPLPLTEDHP